MSGFITFPASTSGQASLNYGQGVAPTLPTDGDQWYDSTQKTLKQSVNGAIYTFSSVLNVQSIAPAALTALTGTGTFATVSLPTSFMNVPGKVLRVKLYGISSCAASQTPTI